MRQATNYPHRTALPADATEVGFASSGYSGIAWREPCDRVGAVLGLGSLPRLGDGHEPESRDRSYIRAVFDHGGTTLLFFIPGRIEVLGKHTDYAGGDSLTCAVHLGFRMDVEAAEGQISVTSRDAQETATYDLTGSRTSGDAHWMLYADTVLTRLGADFPDRMRGFNITFESSLPIAAGMSSSSALVCGLFLCADEVCGFRETEAYQTNISNDFDLGAYMGAVENGWNYGSFAARPGVGLFGGSEDQTAIMCSREGALGHYSYLPTVLHEYVPLPEDVRFVIASSGVEAVKTGNAQEQFNRLSTMASEIPRLFNELNDTGYPHLASLTSDPIVTTPHIHRAIRTADPADQPDLFRRLAHFQKEQFQVIPKAIAALKEGNLSGFGTIVDASQDGAESLLGNQVDETIFLARKARELGAFAASAFGAGFGGSVWCMTSADRADSLVEAWEREYAAAFPDRAGVFFVAEVGGAAGRLRG